MQRGKAVNTSSLEDVEDAKLNMKLKYLQISCCTVEGFFTVLVFGRCRRRMNLSGMYPLYRDWRNSDCHNNNRRHPHNCCQKSKPVLQNPGWNIHRKCRSSMCQWIGCILGLVFHGCSLMKNHANLRPVDKGNMGVHCTPYHSNPRSCCLHHRRLLLLQVFDSCRICLDSSASLIPLNILECQVLEHSCGSFLLFDQCNLL